VFDDEGAPFPDNFGATPFDAVTAPIELAAVFKGRGGGFCIEDSGGGFLATTLGAFWDCSGPFSYLVSWWRGPETAIGGNHTIFNKGSNAVTRVALGERANATQNWVFPNIDNGVAGFSPVQSFTADPGNFAYNAGVDTLLVRDGVNLDAWSWFTTPNTSNQIAYHEGLATVGALDDMTNILVGSVFGSDFGSGLDGRQVKAIYLFESALTRNDGDAYRHATTTSQVEV
jgi:hypothetical protein